jgi:predicted nucleotidyltransferase
VSTDSNTPSLVRVDLVPFGGLQDENATIHWPVSKKTMSVLGFEEALDAAGLLHFGKLSLQVVSLPAWVGLKLLAHSERAAAKDLADVDFVLSNYANCVDDERVYQALDATDAHSFENSGPHVIGLDLRTIFGAETRRVLSSALDTLLAGGDSGPLARLVSPNVDDWDAAHERIRQKFRRLACGLQGSLSEGT